MAKTKPIIDAAPLQCKGTIQTIRFYNAETYYSILIVKVTDIMEMDEKDIFFNPDFSREIIVTGTVFDPKIDEELLIKATAVKHDAYGPQYQINSVERNFGDVKTDDGKRRFMYRVFTELQVENLYDALDDPFEAFENADIEALLQVSGIGLTSVRRMLDKFDRYRGSYQIYAELPEFELSDFAIKVLLEKYNSYELIIKTLKENPYRLILDRVPGLGWKRVDALAIRGGMDVNDHRRIMGFIYYYLDNLAEEGDSYVSVEELQGGIDEYLGKDTNPVKIGEALRDLEKEEKLWCDKEHTKVGNMYYYKLEDRIASELLRIRDSENLFEYDGWEERVKKLEEVQGFEFTEEQWTAIETALKEQVILITGKGGTGKTRSVSGILTALGSKYSSITCALAGRAAARLSEVTYQEGYTIHRALNYTPQNGWGRNRDFPLEEDIIICDEVSMISADIFERLVQAIRTGAKLIMLGDVAQLPPIGCGNIANDILESPYIPTIRLTKIHRQAQQSAIVTESIKISNGQYIISKDWTGKDVRGILQDLRIDCYASSTNTFYRVIEHFNTAVEQGVPLDDIQIILPTKVKGDASVYNINNTVQELVNPAKGQAEIDALFEKDKIYTLREGDRIVNRVNNYEAQRWEGDEAEYFDPATGMYTSSTVPVYNGNIGIVKRIYPRRKMVVVDFREMGTLVIQKSQINALQLGYAITCHSAQGSEMNYVIIGIDTSAWTMLSRQWLYTAITRAKKICILCCESHALSIATAKNEIIIKRTHLQERIKEHADPSF